MHLMICLMDVLCSNEDVENPSVPVADAAIPVANNDDLSSEQPTSWRVKQICYSPIYYYFKVIITIYGTVSAVMLYLAYQSDCAEWANNMEVKAWFYAMAVLWAIQGLVHLFFIVVRFITKHPPSNTLYSGKFEAILKWPLMIEMVILIVIAVVGLILLKSAENESEVCVGKFNKIKTHSIIYIVLGLLMVMRFGRAKSS
jgi:hypothetical protein